MVIDVVILKLLLKVKKIVVNLVLEVDVVVLMTVGDVIEIKVVVTVEARNNVQF